MGVAAQTTLIFARLLETITDEEPPSGPEKGRHLVQVEAADVEDELGGAAQGTAAKLGMRLVSPAGLLVDGGDSGRSERCGRW